MIRRAAGALCATACLVSGAAAQGVKIVKDIRPSGGNSNPSNLLAIDDTVFFAANDGSSGTELWKSDGTEEGTVRVRNINGGSSSSDPEELYDWDGTLYFSATGNGGRELWKSDGTEPGTTLVKDINPSGPSSPAGFAEHRDRLYFAATTANHGREVWFTDGTSGGTNRATDIVSGIFNSNPEQLTTAGDILYFTSLTTTLGRELFKINSAGVPSLLADINPIEDSRIDNLTALDSILLFSAKSFTVGNEIWKATGPVDGTVGLKDINSGEAGSGPQNFLRVGNFVFFSADDGERGIELYITDGTANGTNRVKNINPGSSDSEPMHLAESQGILYFSAKVSGEGRELWRSDGSEAGTWMVADINPNGNSDPEEIVAFGSGVAFTADDGEHGRELWYSDGTEEGTRRISDIVPGSGEADIAELTPAGEILFFSADDGGDEGRELWSYEQDLDPPDCIAIVPNTVGPTNANTIVFTVEFDEPVSNFDDEDDLVFLHSGTNHSTVEFDTDDDIVWTVTVGGITGAGSLGLRVQTDPEIADVEDSTGNPLATSVTSAEVFIDRLAPSSVCSSPAQQVGGQVLVTVTQIDGTGSAVLSVSLWGRRDDGDWAFIGDISGFQLAYTPPASGRYHFQTVAVDSVANSEPAPSGQGDTTLVYNQVANGPVTVTPLAGESIRFPMSSQSNVLLDFSAATPTSPVTVQRHVPEANVPPVLNAASLIDESLSIAGTFGGTVSMDWTYAPVSDDSIGGLPNTVYASGATLRLFAPMVNGTTLSVDGIDAFSDWFAGIDTPQPEYWALD